MLAGESPVPPTFGLRLRVLHLARQLARAADVEVAFNSPPAPGRMDGEPFTATELPLEWGVPRWERVRRLWLPREVAIPRGRAMRRLAAVRRPDTAVAHTLPLVRPALRAGAPVILDAQNVMTELLSSLGAARAESLRTRRYERAVARRVAAVAVVSDSDAAAFERLGARRVAVVPNGVDVAAVPYAPPAEGARLVYVGNFEWPPNALAARELVREVIPRVRAELPDASATLVGHWPQGVDAARAELGAGPEVELTGRVAETGPYLRSARVALVPLRAGGGTRLKVLEALAAGVPVVSTRFGVSGLGLVSGREVLAADTAAGLAEQAVRVIRDDRLALGLSRAGRRRAERDFDWSAVAVPLVELNERLARGG